MMAMAGADSLEILVKLRDLTGAGFKKIQGEITATERAASGANLSGFSKSAKNIEKDAEKAAGKAGGGGIGGMAAGLLGLGGGPVTAAVVGLGALTAAGIGLYGVYDHVQRSEADLDAAFKTNHETLAANKVGLDALINTGANYGQGADQVRGAVLELAQAGHSWQNIQESMPTILTLAQQKHLDLATAAKQVELAEMGNARALKDLGVALPLVTNPMQAQKAATAAVTAAQAHMDSTTQHLTDVENALGGKHKLTAAEAIRLRDAHKAVDDASQKLKTAQDNLATSHDTAGTAGKREEIVLKALNERLGPAAPHATALEQAQAKMGNTMQHVAVVVGPIMDEMFRGLLDVISNVANFIVDSVFPAIGGLFNWLNNLMAPVGGVLGPFKFWFDLMFDIWGIIGNIIGKLIEFIGWIGQAGKAIADSPIGKVVGAIGSVVGAAGGVIGGIGGFIGGHIPHFASGGVVTRPTFAMLGEGGESEYVIPASRMGGMGGGQTVIQHTSIVQIDGREIARQMDRYLHRTLVGAGSGIRRPLGG